MSTIIGVKTYDLRFPTSSTLSDSDAMNKDPDYPRHTSSSPPTRMRPERRRLRLHCRPWQRRGRGWHRLALPHARRPQRREPARDMRAAWDMFVHDSQLRWLGPEEGVEHMAIGAVLSAPSTDRGRHRRADADASCTSSICRRAASRSCRSTPRASPGRRRSCSNTCSPTSSACACAPPRRRCRPVRGGASLRHVRLPGDQWTMG
mgnify:CR=1 FL=1